MDCIFPPPQTRPILAGGSVPADGAAFAGDAALFLTLVTGEGAAEPAAADGALPVGDEVSGDAAADGEEAPPLQPPVDCVLLGAARSWVAPDPSLPAGKWASTVVLPSSPDVAAPDATRPPEPARIAGRECAGVSESVGGSVTPQRSEGALQTQAGQENCLGFDVGPAGAGAVAQVGHTQATRHAAQTEAPPPGPPPAAPQPLPAGSTAGPASPRAAVAADVQPAKDAAAPLPTMPSVAPPRPAATPVSADRPQTAQTAPLEPPSASITATPPQARPGPAPATPVPGVATPVTEATGRIPARPARGGKPDQVEPTTTAPGAERPALQPSPGANPPLAMGRTSDAATPAPDHPHGDAASAWPEPDPGTTDSVDGGPEMAPFHPAGAGHSAPPHRSPPPASSDLPQGVGHRIAEAVVHSAGRQVEIVLTPEELGRVQLSLTTADGGLTLVVQADRPDTLDLLRRHIDTLAQDFRELGFRDLSFSFGQQRERAPDQAPDLSQDNAPEPAQTPAFDTARALRPMHRHDAAGSLDIRL